MKNILFSMMLILLSPCLIFAEVNATATIKSVADSYIVNAVNNEPFEIFLILDFPRLEGLTPDTELPVVIPIHVGVNEHIYTLSPKPEARRLSYSSQYNFLFGNPLTTKPDNTWYYFPYKHGTKHRISQGWHGDFSHGGQNEYAIDFDLDKGEEIYAARGGMVISIKEDSQRGGLGRQYDKFTNFVMIRHIDGTFGNYAHIDFNGVIVAVGDEVNTGELIAYSGDTGNLSGPHLHFDVRIPTLEGEMMSIPFSFRGLDGEELIPQTGHSYYASFEGGPSFEVINGADLINEDYKDYKLILNSEYPSDTLQIRKEVIDNTIVLFIANGFDKGVSADIFLILANLVSDISSPISKDIPPRTEVFLTLVRMRDVEKPFEIKSRLRYVMHE